MYLRKMGRRYLLLHCQRMGDGRVRQRRLGHFEQAAELRQSLSCGRWRAEFERKFPKVSVDWQQLGRLAEAREQFSCLDRWDFRRHYQLAALASQQQEHDQALCPCSKAC